jgi:hypothetical protein
MDYKITLLLSFWVSFSTAMGQPKDSQCDACVYSKQYGFSSTDTLAKQLISKILALESLPPCFAVEPCDGLETCEAYTFPGADDHQVIRYIFYDRQFIRKIMATAENNWNLICILTHEIGHHLLGHTLSGSDLPTHRQRELEADEFAGKMMARMGSAEADAVNALTLIYNPPCDMETNERYPCFEHRKEAILRGFRSVPEDLKMHNFQLNKDLDKVDISSFSDTVGDQGNESSCVGFSLSYALETEIRIKLDTVVRLSPAYIFYASGGSRTDGQYLNKALQFLVDSGAVAENALSPYRIRNESDKIVFSNLESARKYRITSFSPVTIDERSFRQQLRKKKAIIISMRIYQHFFNATDGICRIDTKDTIPLGIKSMAIVGYDARNKIYKFKNSWGTSWGDSGYGYIPFTDLNKLVEEAYVLDITKTRHL